MFQPVKELNRTCRAMQQRVVELISRVSNEEVTEELLHVNDDLNNIFLRYERYGQTGCHLCATQYSFIHFSLRYSDCHDYFFCFILNVKFFSYPLCNA